MKRLLFAVVVALLVVVPASAAETVDAVWSERTVDFTFFGLGTAYSCDLLEGRIEALLHHLGAAEINLSIPSCAGFAYPQRHRRVFIEFTTLVPAGGGDVDAVKAAWHEVELGKRHPRAIEDRDCELLEQFQKVVLPEVEHEVVEGATQCGATMSSIVGRLRLKVLKPVAADATPGEDE